VQLQNIDLGKLVAAAGGDPWAVNESLQCGRPAQISDLARAFHNAGQCTAEASSAFVEACRRFEASWNRENGEHPINDSAEVQRATSSLGLQTVQLPRIAVDLENIAAALAEAQRTCGVLISTLEKQLQGVDRQIGEAEELEKNSDLSDYDRQAVEQLIASLEHQAVDDTGSTLIQLESIRAGYSDYLAKSQTSLRADGYDSTAAEDLGSKRTEDQDAEDQDAEGIPPSERDAAELADLQRVTNQAVPDQVAKVQAARQAINDALATAYTNGQGSSEGQAALARLPQLKQNLADTLNVLDTLPDYNNVDPAAIRTSPDGHFIFGYTANGQPVQVTGQLKNGNGEIFDQGTGTYYTFKDGKLVGARTPDPGRVEAEEEPLLSAVTLGVGGAPTLKAGSEAIQQGLKALVERQAFASGSDVMSDNLLPRALAAETRTTQQIDHALEHPSVPGENFGAPLSDHHAPVLADGASQAVAEAGRPEFTLDNPLDHMSPQLQALSEQHLTGSGETVLGPYRPIGGGSSYIDVAQEHGASYFDIGDAWNTATPTERLAANQHVLDIAIANRDTVTLSVPLDFVDADTFTAAEIKYLELCGYRQINEVTWVPPTRGIGK
jgi:hypothetical protein